MYCCLINCKNCNKEYLFIHSNIDRIKIRQFCRYACRDEYMIKNRLFAMYNRKIRNASQQTNRKNRTSSWFDPKIKEQINNNNRRLKRGMCFDPKIQSMGGKIGGLIGGPMSAEILRNKKGYIFNRVHFDSKSEMEIGMCIHYQIEKIVDKHNYQFKIGSKHIDFFIRKYNCFIEFHQIIDFDRLGLTIDNYYAERRKILDENKYEKYNLIVIK